MDDIINEDTNDSDNSGYDNNGVDFGILVEPDNEGLSNSDLVEYDIIPGTTNSDRTLSWNNFLVSGSRYNTTNSSEALSWQDYREYRSRVSSIRDKTSIRELILSGHVGDVIRRIDKDLENRKTLTGQDISTVNSYLRIAIATLHVTMVAEIVGIMRLYKIEIDPDLFGDIDGIVNENREMWEPGSNNNYYPIDGNRQVSKLAEKIARIAVIKTLISPDIPTQEFDEKQLSTDKCYDVLELERRDIENYFEEDNEDKGFVFVKLSGQRFVDATCVSRRTMREYVMSKAVYTCLDVDADVNPDKSKRINHGYVGVQPIITISLGNTTASIYLASLVNMMRLYKAAIVYLIPAEWQILYTVSENVIRPDGTADYYVGNSHGQMGTPHQIYSLAVCIGESCKLSNKFNLRSASDVDNIDLISFVTHSPEYKLADYKIDRDRESFGVSIEPLGKFMKNVDLLLERYKQVDRDKSADNDLDIWKFGEKLREMRERVLEKYQKYGLSDVTNINSHRRQYVTLVRMYPIFVLLIDGYKYSRLLHDDIYMKRKIMSNNMTRSNVVDDEKMQRLYTNIWKLRMENIDSTVLNFKTDGFGAIRNLLPVTGERYTPATLSLITDLYNTPGSKTKNIHMEEVCFRNSLDTTMYKSESGNFVPTLERYKSITGDAYIDTDTYGRTVTKFPIFNTYIPLPIMRIFGKDCTRYIWKSIEYEDGTATGFNKNMYILLVYLSSIVFDGSKVGGESDNILNAKSQKKFNENLAQYYSNKSYVFNNNTSNNTSTGYKLPFMNSVILDIGFFLGVVVNYEGSAMIRYIFESVTDHNLTIRENLTNHIHIIEKKCILDMQPIFRNWAMAYNEQYEYSTYDNDKLQEEFMLFQIGEFYTKFEINIMILYLYMVMNEDSGARKRKYTPEYSTSIASKSEKKNRLI